MNNEDLTKWFENDKNNNELLKLYESKWDIVEKIFNIADDKENSLVLFLSSIPYNYYKTNHKILMIGQENNGWGYFSSPKESMRYTLGFQNIRRWEQYPIFTFPYNFCASINECDINETKKSYLAWTNLRKFSFDEEPKKYLEENIQKIIDEEFNILADEIKIINPDIVLFLTGYRYDNDIKKQLSGVEFSNVSGYNINQFSRLKHSVLPYNSFRIYHPGYLQRSKLYYEYLDKLREECNLN